MSVGGREQVLSNTLSNISQGSTSQPVYTVAIKAKSCASCDDHHGILSVRCPGMVLSIMSQKLLAYSLLPVTCWCNNHACSL